MRKVFITRPRKPRTCPWIFIFSALLTFNFFGAAGAETQFQQQSSSTLPGLTTESQEQEGVSEEDSKAKTLYEKALKEAQRIEPEFRANMSGGEINAMLNRIREKRKRIIYPILAGLVRIGAVDRAYEIINQLNVIKYIPKSKQEMDNEQNQAETNKAEAERYIVQQVGIFDLAEARRAETHGHARG